MLGTWRTHAEFQSYLSENVLPFYISDRKRVEFYASALSKLYLLDLDPLIPIFQGVLSHTGTPSNQQPEILRSFILMSELRTHSITKWVKKLNAENLLCHMIGVDPENVPGVGSHYDFLDRLWMESPDVEENRRESLYPFKRKPRKKLGKNKKQPPRHPGIIQKLVDLALQGRTFENRPELLIQQIFAKVAVKPSAKEGILGDTKKLGVSGDGTCIETGGSPFGVKVCKCIENKDYNCDCWRKFSDLDARHGWDSHHEEWYYGHCGYFLSVYNYVLKCDIPIYPRMVQAQRYDGVSAIVVLAEARKLYPQFTFERFYGDSAHDNYPTYHLLNEWNIKAIIPLNEKNKGNFKYQPPIKVDNDGRAICMGGFAMIPVEFQEDRCRIKNRCPLKLGKIDSCSCKDQCSPSDYGRTIYTKPEWDLRLFTAIPRGTEVWNEEMKKRTTSERVNKRILNDYQLEQANVRG